MRRHTTIKVHWKVDAEMTIGRHHGEKMHGIDEGITIGRHHGEHKHGKVDAVI